MAGSSCYYVLGPIGKPEAAVTHCVYELLEKDGWIPAMGPKMVTARVAAGSGYVPRGEERQCYKIENEDLNLIATAEMALTGLYADELLDQKELPKAFVGYSPAYRMEAGAYGKYSKGLYRGHQFNTLEMYVFCLPSGGEAGHKRWVGLEGKI